MGYQFKKKNLVLQLNNLVHVSRKAQIGSVFPPFPKISPHSGMISTFSFFESYGLLGIET